MKRRVKLFGFIVLVGAVSAPALAATIPGPGPLPVCLVQPPPPQTDAIAQPIEYCGDCLCQAYNGEDCNSCPTDCSVCAGCGDGIVDADAGEQCDSTPCCQSNCTFAAAGVVCNTTAGPCVLPETCSGISGNCPASVAVDAGVVCRPDAGACDVAEACDGVSGACPTDSYLPSNAVCRPGTGACDLAETCSGTGPDCPADAFADAGVVCRPDAGICDLAEACTGTGPACPGDSLVGAGIPCRTAAGICDLAEACTGAGPSCPPDSFASSGTTCRAASGLCDLAESCPGNSPSCPSDSRAADGTSCSDGLYCDGAETCQGGSCTSGAPPSCVDPAGRLAMTCDGSANACVPLPDQPPSITRDAILTGAAGVLYPLNAAGHLDVMGSPPIHFSSCGGPAGLRVDADTGTVEWTPAAAGPQPLCLAAANAFGTDSYSFTVDVAAEATGSGPTAAFTATPEPGGIGQAISFDGSASAVTGAPAGYRWDQGDMGPRWTGQPHQASFLVPGGYQVELAVLDAAGRTGTAKQPVRVRDAQGRLPPVARIQASAISGTDSLDVDFTSLAQQGDRPIAGHLWLIGDTWLSGQQVHRTFAPGRYRVRLFAVDDSGLAGSDGVEISVSRGAAQPPRCRAELSPPAGPAPFTTWVRALVGDPDGLVVSHSFRLADGTTSAAAELPRTVDQPGRELVVFTATDDQGLTCTDSVEIRALTSSGGLPPRILDPGAAAARCGLRYVQSASGGPAFSGTGAPQWTVAAAPGGSLPPGLTVDPSTGAVDWVPTSHQSGPQSFLLEVQTPYGADSKLVQVDVACAGADLGVTCGIRSRPEPWGIALVLGLLAARARRRRV